MGQTATGSAPSLRTNATGLVGAVIMSAALMGPAVSVYFNPQVAAANAGVATPFVFALGLVVMLIVANGVMEMARVLPSAGAFYTYVSRGIGARSGFVTGALMFAAYALLVPAEIALVGIYTHDVLADYGINVHWALISAVAVGLLVFLSRRHHWITAHRSRALHRRGGGHPGTQRRCTCQRRRPWLDTGPFQPLELDQRTVRYRTGNGLRDPVLRRF